MGIPKHLKLYFLFVFLATSTSALASSPWSDDQDDYSSVPPSPPPAPCNSKDRNILLKIKQAFNNSDLFITWIPDSDCCNGWELVECDDLTGRINSFDLSGNHLSTIFPPLVGKLTHLKFLIFKNNITGLIPSFLSNLRRLQSLNLSGNRFSGPIPYFITQFRHLTTLDLSHNQLIGKIPTQLSRLPKLFFISLANNKLTGRIPRGLFSSYKGSYYSPPYLILSSNRLTGPIPRSFQRVDFWGFEVADNKLKGDASFLFGPKKKSLTHIDLSKNRFSFNMSDLEMPYGIITLLLNNNKLYGRLPNSLTTVSPTLLTYFNVSYNRLCGQIPVDQRLQKFGASAYSHNKCLCGTPLPTCS